MSRCRCLSRSAVGLLLCASLSARAQEASTDERAFEAGLHWQVGEVSLGDGIARLDVTPEWRFLGPDDARRVLVEGWHNPPDADRPLGMLCPADVSPVADDGWGIVISFQPDGHVSDADAAEIDYDALLKELQAGAREANEARTKAGYPAVELIGWAAKPYYDPATHKLHWARELQFGSEQQHTLNYDVRVLGRRGVLVMKAVASMQQVDAVQTRMRDALALVEFSPGHRYEEFDSKIDEVAAYGIGGLVACGLLAKAGFFKMLLVGLLAAKKFVIIGVLAAVGAITRFWRATPATWLAGAAQRDAQRLSAHLGDVRREAGPVGGRAQRELRRERLLGDVGPEALGRGAPRRAAPARDGCDPTRAGPPPPRLLHRAHHVARDALVREPSSIARSRITIASFEGSG